jgi:hypothetical protein
MCRSICFGLVVVIASAAILSAPASADEPGGFTPLFNGRDFTGWSIVQRDPKDLARPNPDPKTVWTVGEAVLKCTGKPNGYLATTKEYAKYTLRVKWRWPAAAEKANSGVLLHVQADNTKDWPECVEAQLKAGQAGELWLTYPPKVSIEADPARHDPKQPRRFLRIAGREKPVGEWNQYEITCRDGAITLTLNGELANEGKKCSLTKGRIALQSEGTPVEFKDIEIKELR